MPIDDSIIDDDEARRRQMWRHLRAAITLVVLIVLVVGGALFSWNKVTGDEPSTSPQTGPTCLPAQAKGAPKPTSITLNVYNATSRNGLAAKVAAQMSDRGFKVSDVANDPENQSIDGPAQIRANADQQAAVSVVMGHIPGAEFVVDDRSTGSVDLVVGDSFKKLANPNQATPVSAKLPTCEPSPAS